jgi:ABC-2 type transport system permease protein
MVTLSGNLLPLTLFPDSWQKVITMLPYAQLLDAPIRLYSGEYAISEAPVILLRQFVWVVVLILIGIWLWDMNRKKMIIQGG